MSRVRNRFLVRLPARGRAQSLAVGAILMGLLLTASRLEPNASGMGTHRRLGLPYCLVRSWTGLPCPSCGMTTAWSHYTRGDWKEAWRTHPLGLLLAVSATLAAPGFVTSAATGWAPRLPRGVSAGLGWGVLAAALVQWVAGLLVH
jgi:hypothetical protein